MATKIFHSEITTIDRNGNEKVVYPQNDGTDVSIDTSSNNSIPEGVSTLQNLVDTMGAGSFMSGETIDNMRGDIDNIKVQTTGIIVPVPVSRWVSNGTGYVNTVTVEGLTGREPLTAYLYDDGALTENEVATFDQLISRVETRDNAVVLYATELPNVSFTIALNGDMNVTPEGLSGLGDLKLLLDTINGFDTKVDLQTSRIDNIVGIDDGHIAAADGELIDIRVKYDGTTATTAGGAVRAQISELHDDINALVAGGVSLKDEVISKQVNKWLEDHPESLVSVIDKSITVNKMADEFWEDTRITNASTLNNHEDTYFAKATDITEVNKALESKLSPTDGISNNYVTFTSGDETDTSKITDWTSVAKLEGGMENKHSSLFNKISLMFKNIRYLYKMLGTTNISTIGNGTVTGALDSLNSNLGKFQINSLIANLTFSNGTSCDANNFVDCTITFDTPINSQKVMVIAQSMRCCTASVVSINDTSMTVRLFNIHTYAENAGILVATYSLLIFK